MSQRWFGGTRWVSGTRLGPRAWREDLKAQGLGHVEPGPHQPDLEPKWTPRPWPPEGRHAIVKGCTTRAFCR